MMKLTDTQCILLSTAAVREDGMLLPVPETLNTPKATVLRTIAKLIATGLAAELQLSRTDLAIRSDGDAHIGAAITEAGLAAIGVVVPGSMELATAADIPTVPSAPPPITKSALVLSLLLREQGATLAEMVDATGWLPHTTRAALTGLRKKGHGIDRRKRGEETCYYLPELAA